MAGGRVVLRDGQHRRFSTNQVDDLAFEYRHFECAGAAVVGGSGKGAHAGALRAERIAEREQRDIGGRVRRACNDFAHDFFL
ncbi:hypothetical protein [Burkholderia glumae]|uniref:hypothetical protein n=1 Tax=Burkholderia glumae TaxID=337 RepID=UPI0020CEB375|nr:hypothetical protein [Burkholderia glumae]MCQ0030383.1 hypothetical protein [Burkholderia glumae]MCQ0035700.1 hypothetical protein [Burkholderia glumae]